MSGPPPEPATPLCSTGFDETGYRFEVDENVGGGATPVAVGTVSATDTGAAVRYSITAGNDAGRFAIDAESGAITHTDPGEDYEGFADPANTFVLTVRASDCAEGANVKVVVAVTDADGPPPAPPAPVCRDVRHDGLVLDWRVPVNPGPPITAYNVRWRVMGVGAWSELDDTTPSTATTATITGLMPDAAYEVQVRAGNAEGDGPWSPSGRVKVGVNLAGPARVWLARFGRTVADHVMVFAARGWRTHPRRAAR